MVADLWWRALVMAGSRDGGLSRRRAHGGWLVRLMRYCLRLHPFRVCKKMFPAPSLARSRADLPLLCAFDSARRS